MSIEVHLSFQISAFAFFRHRPGVELLGYVVVLLSVFEKLQCCFPQWPHQFTLLPTVYEDSLFSTSSPTFGICVLFDDSHSGKCEVIAHCGFNLHFPTDLNCGVGENS